MGKCKPELVPQLHPYHLVLGLSANTSSPTAVNFYKTGSILDNCYLKQLPFQKERRWINSSRYMYTNTVTQVNMRDLVLSFVLSTN